MFKEFRLSNLLIALGLTSAVLLHVWGAIHLPFLQSFERYLYDQSLIRNAPGGQDQHVVIANIDDKSLQELGQWPWRRDVLAQLVTTLFDDYQVKALGFDMVFSEPSDDTGSEVLALLAGSDLSEHPTFQSAYHQLNQQLDFDQQFAASLEDKNVVLGIVLEQAAKINTNQLPLPILKEIPLQAKSNAIPKAKSFVTNLPEFHQNVRWAGFFDNPLLDEDGVFRRVAAVQTIGKYVYPSLALQLASAALDTTITYELGTVKTADEFYVVKQIALDDNVIPVGQNGELLVPYRGPQHSFAYFSIYDILTGTIDTSNLKDKVVLVGSDAAGLLDLRTTPFSNIYPGVEVHANIVSGILENRVMAQPANMNTVQTIGILICAIVLFVFGQMRFVIYQMLSLVLAVASIWYLSQWYWQQGVVMPVAPLLFSVIALFFIQTLINMFVEARHKLSLAKRFGQYIPPELVEQMTKDPDKYSLATETKQLTVLFSDIRSFTTISETLTADELSELMNAYLTRMTHIIHQHNGTIDKYMGDAIMAFWGAPFDDEEHAVNAAKAAQAMTEELHDLNVEFLQKGWPELKIGVGLNTDIMFVGDMGSEFRMAYTAMGDGVNLGSRLEGLTKQYGVEILIGENTAAQLQGFYSQELDRVRVKGKTEPVAIYHLRPESLSSLTHFAEFLQAYRQQEWPKALEYLASWQQQNPVLADMYLARIEEYQQTPPGDEWDGVYSHKEK